MSRELKAVLTAQWGDYGLPPGQSSFGVHALVTSHYFQGGAYPVGGSGRIAASLLPTIERTGGALVIGAEVERILVERERAVGVQMADGRVFRAPHVVSDAESARRSRSCFLNPNRRRRGAWHPRRAVCRRRWRISVSMPVSTPADARGPAGRESLDSPEH